MSSHFQSAMLGTPFAYPNAVAWSDENFLAVSCSNTVLIMDPAKPSATSRGLVNVPSCELFPVGLIDGEGEALQSGCLIPFELSRDTRQFVRSISWSPVGLSNNAGCLLAVCTNRGRVKLYRFPFWELTAEWIEVVDISEMLHTYLMDNNFRESQITSSPIYNVSPLQHKSGNDCASDKAVSSTLKRCKRKRKKVPATEVSDDSEEDKSWEMVPVYEPKEKARKKVSREYDQPLITPQQYASRRAMLSPLIVAWSPILSASQDGVSIPHNSSSCCSILAVGEKNGGISFWRIHAPECYSIDNRGAGKVSFIGLLKAHDSWITGISWVLYGSDASTPQFLLASGSADGRVKIWQVNGEELLRTSDVNHSLTLLEEVATADFATVSMVALCVSYKSPWKVQLAIGKGSGSIELIILDLDSRNFEKAGLVNAHDSIVTGLSWAFGGRCLYSCGQDNSMKSWNLVENSLSEMPIPSNPPGLKSSHVAHVSDCCFGLAVSPGNLAIALARRFDADLLDPMYAGRAHKGAIEFLWIGGQPIDISCTTSLDNGVESVPGFSKELKLWESNILWSLNQFENPSRILNIWDIVAALTAFKEELAEFVDYIILKWLKLYFGPQFGIASTFLPKASTSMPKLSSRQLHLINIIIRHVVLGKRKAQQGLDSSSNNEEHVKFWTNLLLSCENELRERLVGFGFSAFLSVLSHSPADANQVGGWIADGLVQMENWVLINANNVKAHMKVLAIEVGRAKRKLKKIIRDEGNEECIFCSATVPFKSTEYAICSDGKCSELKRCSVTMRVCPTRFSWSCACCQRKASKLAPRILFILSECPTEFRSFMNSYAYKESLVPCCPFCGILLGKSLPEHFLSPSPV